MIFSEVELLANQIDDDVVLAAFWRLWAGGAIDEAHACKTVPEAVSWLNQETLDKGWNDEDTSRAARRAYAIEHLECWLDSKALAAQELVLGCYPFEGGGTRTARTSENKYPLVLVEVIGNGGWLFFGVNLLDKTVVQVPSTLSWFQQFDEL